MYGLDSKIKKFIDDKIEKNKTYLKNLTFYNEDYKLVSMFDSDLNANLSPQRYFAEVNNRVNTLFSISQELELVPAFLTITAPPEYHFKSKHYNGSTPRQTALFLSSIWAKYLNLMVFRHMKDNTGHKMIYIRVYEPHKSGVPHLHAMIFIPKTYLKNVKLKFFEHFTKFGTKKIALKFIDRFDNSKKYDGVSGAIAYILKYMNKTFKNAKDDVMSNEAYYFAYHGIRRFITSQTLIPLWIYRKIKHNDDTRDLLKLTKDYKKGLITHHFDKTFITQKYIKKEKIVYASDDIEISLSIEDRVIYQKNNFISQQFKNSDQVYEDIPTKWVKQKVKIPIYQNGLISHFYKDGLITKFLKHISMMSNFELFQNYENYDIDSYNNFTYCIYTKKIFDNSDYVKYLAIQNLLVTRNMLDKDLVDLNNFKIDDFFEINNKNYKWYCSKDIGLIN